MTIIACVDERNGLMFNHRRQSRDSVVCQDILRECSGKDLYMSEYSGKLFKGTGEAGECGKDKEIEPDTETGEVGGTESVRIRISQDILHQIGKEDVCFIEDTDITGFKEQVQKVILYKWNRKYPADRYFPLNLSDGSWELSQTGNMQGSSHEKITKETYERKAND